MVADRTMLEYYKNEDMETYLLTVLNMVSTLSDLQLKVYERRMNVCDADHLMKQSSRTPALRSSESTSTRVFCMPEVLQD